MMNPFEPTKRSKKQSTSSSLVRAIGLSLLIHAVLVLALIWAWPSATSKGEGPVILLEAINKETESATEPQSITQVSPISPQKRLINSQTITHSTPQADNPPSVIDWPVSKQQAPNPQLVSVRTSNNGELVDQSGKATSPQEAYRLQLYKHLTNKMKGAPVTGKAKIYLTLIPSGMAINVRVELISGPAAYAQWVKTFVLNSNPFPVMPKSLGKSQFQTDITVTHINK